MKKLYQFNFSCGRMGSLEGIFIAESSEVEALIGKEIYFGEVLGKHSEVSGLLEESDLQVLTDDQDFIETFERVLWTGTISGYNPLDYYDPDEDDEEEEDEV